MKKGKGQKVLKGNFFDQIETTKEVKHKLRKTGKAELQIVSKEEKLIVSNAPPVKTSGNSLVSTTAKQTTQGNSEMVLTTVLKPNTNNPFGIELNNETLRYGFAHTRKGIIVRFYISNCDKLLTDARTSIIACMSNKDNFLQADYMVLKKALIDISLKYFNGESTKYKSVKKADLIAKIKTEFSECCKVLLDDLALLE